MYLTRLIESGVVAATWKLLQLLHHLLLSTRPGTPLQQQQRPSKQANKLRCGGGSLARRLLLSSTPSTTKHKNKIEEEEDQTIIITVELPLRRYEGGGE